MKTKETNAYVISIKYFNEITDTKDIIEYIVFAEDIKEAIIKAEKETGDFLVEVAGAQLINQWVPIR